MSFFIREADPSDIAKLKKSLTAWGTQKVGKLESQLGDKVELTSCKCCDIYALSLDTLIEKRKSEVKIKPSEKGNLATAPNVAHGSLNIWSTPTPAGFKSDFKDDFYIDDIKGTEFYAPCKSCGEKGNVDCPSCAKTGKEKCGSCNATKRVNCGSCNGYGFFNCSDCNQTGFVSTSCPVCAKGSVDCNSCGGKGYHWGHDNNKIDCRSCNATGDAPCGACGGRGSESVRCGSCNNGQIACDTCRSQKTVPCRTCDPNGNVPCQVCTGRTLIDCDPCKTKGGFKHHEQIVYTTVIEENQILVSPIKDLNKSINYSLYETVNHVKGHLTLEEIQTQIESPELKDVLNDVYKHVNTHRPPATLLDRLMLKKGSVLDIHFKYEGVAGHAFFEPGTGVLVVDVNPIQDKQKKSQDRLLSLYGTAKKNLNFAEARKLIGEAKELKFEDLANKWKNEIDGLEEKQRREIVGGFISKVKIPAFYATGFVFWLIMGFIAPMSLTMLGIFMFLAFRTERATSKDTTVKVPQHKLELKKQLTKLSIYYVIATVLIMGVSYYTSQSTVEKIFKQGMPLKETK